jgi:hypothetical protein
MARRDHQGASETMSQVGDAPLTGLTWASDAPLVTVMDPTTQGSMTR